MSNLNDPNDSSWEQLSYKLLKLVRIKDSIDSSVASEKNKENVKNLLMSKIDNLNCKDHSQTVETSKLKTKNLFLESKLYIAISASVICIISIIFFIQNYQRNEFEINLVTVTTPLGTKGSLTLPDGSKVTLNSNSTLTYPVLFTKNNKRLELEGEAFFEVANQSEQPMVISTGKLDTHIVGTKFNLRAYPEDEEITLTLQEGKVIGTIRNLSNTLEQIVLLPNEQLSVSRSSNDFIRKKVDAKDYSLWINNMISFKYDDLKSIAKTLEYRFNKTIIIDSSLENNTDKYVGTFECNQSLDEILDILSYKQKWKYLKSKNVYRIVMQ